MGQPGGEAGDGEPGALPAAQEQGRGDGGHHEHVGVLRQEENGEAHPAILHVEAGDQLGLGLGNVEGETVALRQGAGEIDQEGHDLGEHVPTRQNAQPATPLGVHQAPHAHGAGEHHRAEHGQDQRHFVAHGLRRRAHGPQDGVLVVGRPARHDDSHHRQRGDGDHVEDADVQVADDDPGPPGDGDVSRQGGGEHDHGGQDEDHPVGPSGDDVLLEQQLDPVRDALRPAVPAPHPHGAEAHLDVGADLPLPPDQEHGRHGDIADDEADDDGHHHQGGDDPGDPPARGQREEFLDQLRECHHRPPRGPGRRRRRGPQGQRSISPRTMSTLPRMATMSATR